ncbi:MAG: kynureninase [Nocardioides sp.]|uniref:kynureninase n=1 Tax=Nocardioides sp. TaxID=35761 RepID=UPI003F04ECAB
MTYVPGSAPDLDAADPLAPLRDRFVGTESDLVYFDGNSLGRPLRATAERIGGFVVDEWGGRLIRGWDERWYDQPLVLGDEIGRVCLGAGPGQAFVGDSTTVLLYKLVRAALGGAPGGRDEIVVDTDNFPTDRYVVEGIASELGLAVRWVEVPADAGITPELLAPALSERTALVVLSHVAYRSGWLADAAAITAQVHEAGALVLWDLCHSAGVVPVELDAWGADLAVGCTYKYLNGGPGSPAFGYVATRHLGLRQPIQGWMGHRDPFLMGPGYDPAPTVRRFISGTPPITAMLGLADMVALIDEVGIAAVREKSVALTEYAAGLAEELLGPYGVTVASPRDPAVRGGHLNLHHDRMREVVAALWERDVIPDYRDPGGLRIGLSPLSTSFAEVEAGVRAIATEFSERVGRS